MQNIPLTPLFEDFEEQSSKGNLIPVYAELSADYETPISIFQKICNGKYSFLLESAESTDRAGRYSFIGSDPRSVIEAQGAEIKITEENKIDSFQSESGDPLKDLEFFMSSYKPVPIEGLPVFYGGAVGYISWDGNMDAAIAIRTAVIKDGLIHVGAGAGVVADSVPENEWQECVQKSKVFADAMEMLD